MYQSQPTQATEFFLFLSHWCPWVSYVNQLLVISASVFFFVWRYKQLALETRPSGYCKSFNNFLLLWQNTWGNQMKEGMIYFGWSLGSFHLWVPSSIAVVQQWGQHIVAGMCDKAKIAHLMQPGDKGNNKKGPRTGISYWNMSSGTCLFQLDPTS